MAKQPQTKPTKQPDFSFEIENTDGTPSSLQEKLITIDGITFVIKDNTVTLKDVPFGQISDKHFHAISQFLNNRDLKITSDCLQKLKEYQIHYNHKGDNGIYISDKYPQRTLDFALADFLRYNDYTEKHYANLYLDYKKDSEDKSVREQLKQIEQAEKARKARIHSDSLNIATQQIFGGAVTPHSPYDFLPQKPILENNHTTRKSTRGSGRGKLNEAYSYSVIKDIPDYGGHIVIIWADQKSKFMDDTIDKKTNIKEDTKLFTYEVRYPKNGEPPEVKFYVGKIGGKISGKETAPCLKEAEAWGYTTFIMPPASEIGKPLFKAFLEGSIITGVVPRLQHYPDDPKGMKFSYGDVNDVMELWREKTKGKDMEKKIQFALRFSHEIEQYCAGGGKEKISTFGQQLKMQALFMKFTNSYLSELQTHMMEKSEGWDSVDVIAAKAAMTRIVEEIQNGSLGGEAYDPLDPDGKSKNCEKIINLFDKYQQNDTLHRKIAAEIENVAETGEYKRNDTRDRQIKSVESTYDNRWNAIIGGNSGVKAYGVEIESRIFPSVRPHIKDKRNTSSIQQIYQDQQRSRA